MKRAYIYGLRDPVVGAIRYVGFTRKPQSQRSVIATESKQNPKLAAWIKSLSRIGEAPIFEVIVEIATSPVLKSNQTEQLCKAVVIGELSAHGADLLNKGKIPTLVVTTVNWKIV